MESRNCFFKYSIKTIKGNMPISLMKKAERAKQSALTCSYPSWRQSSPAISSPSLFLRTKFFAFVLIVHEYSFNHLACEQAHFCKFGENFGAGEEKWQKKKARLTQNCYRALLIIRYRIRTFKSGKRKLLGRSNLFEGLKCFILAPEVRSRKTWMK